MRQSCGHGAHGQAATRVLKPSCRRTISPGFFPSRRTRRAIAQKTKFALTAHLAQRLIRGLGRNRLAGAENPDPLFLVQPNSPSSRPKHNAIFRTFQFQRIARAELHFVANGLGQDDAPRFVEGKSGFDRCHFIMPFAIINWHYNMSPLKEYVCLLEASWRYDEP